MPLDLLPTPTAIEISHSNRVEGLKVQGAKGMYSRKNGAFRPNGITDYLDFHYLLTPCSFRFGLGPKRNEHGNIEPTREEASKPCTADSPQGWWRNFPTQPPVCRGNDGLPFDVDNLTISFSKWRQESIKAYGNAWVPQVAYEIFRAIEEISL